MAAGAPVSTDAIVEMVKHVDVAVLETWLADRNERYGLNAKELVKLADKGVPGSIIDILVALDNPGRLAVRPTTQAVAVDVNRGSQRSGNVSSGGGGAIVNSYPDPWLNPWDPYGMRWRYGVGYDYGYGYGYNRSGYNNYGYPYGGSGPIIIIPRGASAAPSALAVPGSGYTRPGSKPPSSSSTSDAGRPSGSEPRATVPSTTTRGGSGTAGTSTGSSGSSGSSSSGGRTAKGRGGN
jgi:hypothetical protein